MLAPHFHDPTESFGADTLLPIPFAAIDEYEFMNEPNVNKCPTDTVMFNDTYAHMYKCMYASDTLTKFIECIGVPW